MSDNQNINVKNPVSFSKQGVSQVPTTESDSQIIDDVLKELERQETGQKDINSQNTIDSLVEEVGLIGSERQPPDDLPAERKDSGVVKPSSAKSLPVGRQGSGMVKEETENFGEKIVQFLEPLKNAKFEYEKLSQPENEKRIVGVQAIETYLHWVEESRKLLKEDLSDKEKEEISIFIPKRIQEQLKNGTAPPPSVLKDSDETDLPAQTGLPTKQADPLSLSSRGIEEEKSASVDGKENVLHERVRRIEERIKKLNQDKPEYPEELLPLETKKVLVEEEIRNKVDEDLIDNDDNERLEQEHSTQDILNKSSFENKAPVVHPEKEERERLKKAQLAKEIEKDKEEKKQEDKPEQKETATNKKEEVKEETEKEEKISEKPSSAKGYGEAKKKTDPVYTDEQLSTTTKTRVEFHKKLSSINRSEWYQSPSKNRDLVNKQIIQVAGILSGKEVVEIDMNDIQTARIFMFNNAPEKILKHPAFSYVESFYNYQSSQGCIGVNPEEVFLKQKNAGSDLKPLSEESSGSSKGRKSFVEQVSVKKTITGLNTDSEKPSEEIKENDL